MPPWRPWVAPFGYTMPPKKRTSPGVLPGVPGLSQGPKRREGGLGSCNPLGGIHCVTRLYCRFRSFTSYSAPSSSGGAGESGRSRPPSQTAVKVCSCARANSPGRRAARGPARALSIASLANWSARRFCSRGMCWIANRSRWPASCRARACSGFKSGLWTRYRPCICRTTSSESQNTWRRVPL